MILLVQYILSLYKLLAGKIIIIKEFLILLGEPLDPPEGTLGIPRLHLRTTQLDSHCANYRDEQELTTYCPGATMVRAAASIAKAPLWLTPQLD